MLIVFLVFAVWMCSTEWFIRTQPYCGAPIARYVQIFPLIFVAIAPWMFLGKLLPCLKCFKDLNVFYTLAFGSYWVWGVMISFTNFYPHERVVTSASGEENTITCWASGAGNKFWIILMTILLIFTSYGLPQFFMNVIKRPCCHRRVPDEDKPDSFEEMVVDEETKDP